MKVFKSVVLTIIFAVAFTGAAFSQGQMGPGQQQMPDVPASADVSDQEVQQFATALLNIEPLQMELQAEMEEVIVEGGIDLERFQQLMMAMQNPQLAEQVNMTTEEQETIQELQPKLVQIQMDAESGIVEKIEESGLDVDRYQVLQMGAEQDPELLERLRNEIERQREG